MPRRGSRGNSVVSVLKCLLPSPTFPGIHRKGGSWEHGPGCGWQGEASLTQSSTLLDRLLSFPKEPGEEGSADKLSGPRLLESRPWSSQSAADSQRPERGWPRRRAKGKRVYGCQENALCPALDPIPQRPPRLPAEGLPLVPYFCMYFSSKFHFPL